MSATRSLARRSSLALALLAPLAGLARNARACTIEFREHERRYVDTAWPGALVDSATAIARVRATAGTPAADVRGRDGRVTLAVVEWLRAPRGGAPGKTRPDTLRVAGVVVAGDDSNPGPVPYRAVRQAGQHGSCYAREYRVGAEYLLLLRRDRNGGALTPYWSPLAPTNEQVRGAGDPWVAWVRARARAGTRRRG